MCGFFWRRNRYHYLLVLGHACVRLPHLSTNVRVTDFNKQMHYYHTYRGTMGIYFSVSILCVGTNYYANLEIMSCQVIFYHFSIHQDPKNNWRLPFKIQNVEHFLLVSLSVYPGSRRGAKRIRQGERVALDPPLENGARTKRFDREILVPRIPY